MLESKDSFSLVKQNAICVLYFASFSIALLNQKYIERGGRNLLNEVIVMELYPNDFQSLYLKIIQSNSIEEIVISTQTMIINLRKLIQNHKEPRKSSLTQGYYEEIKSIYNKLLNECETNNQQGIVLAITRLDRDVFQLLNEAGYSYSQFPDLFLISQRQNNDELIDAVKTHEKLLIEILNKEEVKVINYKNLNELRNYLEI